MFLNLLRNKLCFRNHVISLNQAGAYASFKHLVPFGCAVWVGIKPLQLPKLLGGCLVVFSSEGNKLFRWRCADLLTLVEILKCISHTTCRFAFEILVIKTCESWIDSASILNLSR